MTTSFLVVPVHWEYEDQLPEDLGDDAYNFMYPMSALHWGVRRFPYIAGNAGLRVYLGEENPSAEESG